MDQPRVAYTKAAGKQLWPSLVEKAYAKAHGCYHAISGGWVAEALFDMTGCPTETLWLNAQGSAFKDGLTPDVAWARLLSFAPCGRGLRAVGGRRLVRL